METTDRFVIDVHPESVDVVDLLTDKVVETFHSSMRLYLAEQVAADLNRKYGLGIDPATFLVETIRHDSPQAFLSETLPAFAARQRADVLTSLAEIEALTAKIRQTLARPSAEA